MRTTVVGLFAIVMTLSGCKGGKAPAAAGDMAGAPNPFRPTELFALATSVKASIANKGDPGGTPIALVPNHLDPYWTPTQIGTGRAASEIGCPSVFQAPVYSPTATGDIAEQRRIIQELINEKYKGISLSAVDATMINDLIQTAVNQNIAFITIDSDAVGSARTLYMGTNNYNAGKKAGQALVAAVGTGKVVALAGFSGAQNAIDRIQGIKDGIAGSGVQLVDVINTTGADTATASAMSALSAHPDLAGFITVYGYEGPAVATLVKNQGKAGMVKIVCFDTGAQVIQFLQDGVISGAVGQRPYFMGYLSVYILYSISTLGVQPTLTTLQPWLIGTNKDVIDTGIDVLTKDTLAEYNAFQASLGVTTGP
jgi:ribose transport system substrate-binding protein